MRIWAEESCFRAHRTCNSVALLFPSRPAQESRDTVMDFAGGGRGAGVRGETQGLGLPPSPCPLPPPVRSWIVLRFSGRGERGSLQRNGNQMKAIVHFHQPTLALSPRPSCTGL